nr:MAK10-like protein [Tanacetum cinerariifolium]
MGDANPIRTNGDYSKPSHEGYKNTIEPPEGNNVVKAISLPQDVRSTSVRRLIKLENQVQRLMEAYITLMPHTQVNKITSSCEICSGPHDTQYCMKNLKQAFIDYASSRTNKIGTKQNRNPSSLKRVHCVNSIVILNKEDEAKKKGNVKSSTNEYEDHEMTMESEEEFKEESEKEEEDSPKHINTFLTMKELRYHEWLLKYP